MKLMLIKRCDSNPRWVKENEMELKKIYGTSKLVGVSFPSAEGGLLECIFEQMRKDSLGVLEDCILFRNIFLY